MLDLIFGYLDVALEMMELPLEPSEQTGKLLYQQLEISDMRDMLVR